MVVLQSGLGQRHVMELGVLMRHPSWVGNHSWEVRVLEHPMADLRWVVAPLLWMELAVRVQNQNSVGIRQISDGLKTA